MRSSNRLCLALGAWLATSVVAMASDGTSAWSEWTLLNAVFLLIVSALMFFAVSALMFFAPPPSLPADPETPEARKLKAEIARLKAKNEANRERRGNSRRSSTAPKN